MQLFKNPEVIQDNGSSMLYGCKGTIKPKDNFDERWGVIDELVSTTGDFCEQNRAYFHSIPLLDTETLKNHPPTEPFPVVFGITISQSSSYNPEHPILYKCLSFWELEKEIKKITKKFGKCWGSENGFDKWLSNHYIIDFESSPAWYFVKEPNCSEAGLFFAKSLLTNIASKYKGNWERIDTNETTSPYGVTDAKKEKLSFIGLPIVKLTKDNRITPIDISNKAIDKLKPQIMEGLTPEVCALLDEESAQLGYVDAIGPEYHIKNFNSQHIAYANK